MYRSVGRPRQGARSGGQRLDQRAHVLRLSGFDGKTSRRQHHRHRHGDSQHHALFSAQIVIVHQKTVGNPGIDPLQRTALFVQALPFECGMRQFTKISQMIRIHFGAHHSGLGTGEGIPKDYVQANAWYNIAAEQRNETAKENLEIITKKMSTAGITKAQEISREYSQAYGPNRASSE